jgi:hypothetical protein
MMRTLNLFCLLPFSVGFALVACGGESGNLPPPPPAPPAGPPVASAAPATTAEAAVDAGPPAPPAPAITLTMGAASPDPEKAPTVRIAAPAKDQVIPKDKAADFQVKLDVKNWQTAPKSSHVHLILDNQPYKPIYDTTKPIKLSELPTGDSLAEGQHVLVAFPSRANHESVKTAGALAVISFWVGSKGKPTVDLTKPMLIYSRPKGDYAGDMANHVLVDFYLANDKLGDGKDHVKIDVTGPGIDGDKTADVTSWGAPYYLDNLQNGSYTVKLDLLDKDGKAVPGPWNSTTRTISIAHDSP